MTPATLALVVGLVEEAVKVTPGIITEFQTIFSNPNPTPADWEALRAKVLSQSYEQLVPNTKL